MLSRVSAFRSLKTWEVWVQKKKGEICTCILVNTACCTLPIHSMLPGRAPMNAQRVYQADAYATVSFEA